MLKTENAELKQQLKKLMMQQSKAQQSVQLNRGRPQEQQLDIALEQRDQELLRSVRSYFFVLVFF